VLTCTFSALATTFTVTSNADSGPGSLRDAINQAAANSATPNLIVFNIADQSRTGRTITIASTLPKLPSNLTIDGTTQPGAPFGISAARVIITDVSATDNFYYFNIVAVNNVQVYGLFLQSVSYYFGIYIQQSNNVTIGAAGKGNIMQGFAAPITVTNNSEEPFTTDNIVIQGNIMGTDESGTSASTTQLNGTSIYSLDVTNLQIGGLNPGEGNLMNQTGEPLEYSLIDPLNFGYVNIQGNKEGTDITGNVRLSPNNTPFLIGGNVLVGQSIVTANITNNVSVGGYEIAFTRSPFTIQGNHIGVGLDGVTNLISGATVSNGDNISLNFCGPGLIGGPDPSQKNYMAGAIVATGTDTYGETSAFSTATINTTNIVVQNATCGHNNGSIKNIQVSSGTEWYWQDAAGNIISNGLDLTNIGPGTYTFVTSIGGEACNATALPILSPTLPCLYSILPPLR
jgi:hypothetical protein